MVYNGNCPSFEMDEDPGYPYFRKPPYNTIYTHNTIHILPCDGHGRPLPHGPWALPSHPCTARRRGRGSGHPDYKVNLEARNWIKMDGFPYPIPWMVGHHGFFFVESGGLPWVCMVFRLDPRHLLVAAGCMNGKVAAFDST